MKILVDEDLPRAVADLLIEQGHEAVHVIEAGLRGKPDDAILQACLESGAALVTADLDFADIRRYALGSHNGIMVLRFPDYFRRQQILDLVSRFLASADLDSLAGALVIVEPGAYRVRRE
ncbi:MAG: DUF5615 family PIN-like protein [Armatimonadetes bacterium]|nr:DUF5615 family PIN-like protein [Armatimonadota bacterium]